MSDTTNIKALRVQIDTPGVGSVAQLRKLAHYLLDHLEAERQRAADLVLHVNTQANMREKAEAELAALKPEINWPVAQKVRSALDRAACPDAFMRIAVEACTESLKCEQVPVEEADYTRYSCGCCGFESLYHTTKGPECNYHKIESEPLFTAPQKLVVLLPVAEDYPIAWSAASVLADVKAAIEAAGGIVKDGE